MIYLIILIGIIFNFLLLKFVSKVDDDTLFVALYAVIPFSVIIVNIGFYIYLGFKKLFNHKRR